MPCRGALPRWPDDRQVQHTDRSVQPGREGDGLFMQYISGLWLDECDTSVVRSAQNLAFEQMNRGFPRGWSVGDSPRDGYLGWGRLQENIVTPHASALAIQDFPREVVANLRELERRGRAIHAEVFMTRSR